MKISIFNIDWAKKRSSKTHIHKIEAALNSDAADVDILILTEAVELNLHSYPFIYKTQPLAFEIQKEINYGKMGVPAYRVIIYSKYPAVKKIDTTDPYTSLCRQFETPAGLISIYGTIIGSLFKKEPYVSDELNNCIADCHRIYKETNTLCLAGDLNTSFTASQYFQISKAVTGQILKLAEICNLDLTTVSPETSEHPNIDHIFLPKEMLVNNRVDVTTAIEKGILSDHNLVVLDILAH